MAQLITIYWRDIPAQVIAENGRGRNRKQAKIELSHRFVTAIDAAAMRAGANNANEYLADWRRTEPIKCAEDLNLEVKKSAAKLEADYSPQRLRKLVEQGGFE